MGFPCCSVGDWQAVPKHSERMLPLHSQSARGGKPGKQTAHRLTLSTRSLTYFKVIGMRQETHRTLLLTEKEDPRISHSKFSIVGPRQA